MTEQFTVVGAPGDDDRGSESGSVHIYSILSDFTIPTESIELHASDGNAGDRFGTSVAISGRTIVVGAPFDDIHRNASSSGSAYVFQHENGQWNEKVKLTPRDSSRGQLFGFSVSISANRIVVGAPFGDGNQQMTGAVYVFRRNLGGTNNWGQEQKIYAGGGAFADEFGTSVAIDGNTIAIGANRDDDRGQDSGSVYVYSVIGAALPWKQSAKLSAPNGRDGDCFGFSISISGNSIAVGAFLHDGQAVDSGMAYVFDRVPGSGGSWNLSGMLVPPNRQMNAHFGLSIAIDGDFVVVGAPFEDLGSRDVGAVYAFERDLGGTNNWGLRQLPTSDAMAGDTVGRAVDVVDSSPGPYAVAGAPLDDNSVDSGAAYFYLSNATVSVRSGNDGDENGPVDGSFLITQSGLSSLDTVVDYRVNGTASSGEDYLALSGRVRIPQGSETVRIPIRVRSDDLVENTETVAISLTAVTSGDPDVTVHPSDGAASIDIPDDVNDVATVIIERASDGFETGPQNGSFTVSQSLASSTDTVINYVMSGTAEAGTDYTQLDGVATIPAGRTATELSVPVLDDMLVEITETVTATVTAIERGNPKVTLDRSRDRATAQLFSEDTATIVIDDTSIDEAQGAMVVTLRLNNAIDIPLDVDVSFIDQSATGEGTDYVNSPQRRTFAAGDKSEITVIVPIVNDNLVEPDETFTAALSTPTVLDGRVVDLSDTGVATILNDDQAVLSKTVLSTDEADDGELIVSIDNIATEDITVLASTNGLTATGGGIDFDDLTNQTVTIPAGSTSASTTINITDDQTVELDETYEVTLADARFAGSSDPSRVVIDDIQATGTIRNDDLAIITIDDVSATEGDAGPSAFTFTVSMDNVSSEDIAVLSNTSGLTATGGGIDFVDVVDQSVIIPAGSNSAEVVVNVTGDQLAELDETFELNLTQATIGGDGDSTRVIIGDDQGIGSIVNDDVIRVAIDDVSLSEGDPVGEFGLFTDFTFTVSIDRPAGEDLTVVASTNAATATNNVDYVELVAQTVTIPAGNTSATVSVTVIRDTLIEPNETFEVNLADARVGGISDSTIVDIRDAQGIGTILNDETAVIRMDVLSAVEGGDAGLLVVINNPASEDITVVANTNGLTATGGGVDFDDLAEVTVTIAAGETSATVPININNDSIIETNETFEVILTDARLGGTSDPTRVTIDEAPGIGTVSNNDLAQISINDVQMDEGDDGRTPFAFTVSIDNPASEDITVVANTSGVTATGGGDDFEDLVNVTVTIPAGRRSQQVVVSVIGDTNVGDMEFETFQVNLSNPRFRGEVDTSRVIIGDFQGIGTIRSEEQVMATGYPVGDANLDGVFSSLDLVTVLRSGEYLTGRPASWAEGDWNGDGEFNSEDLVLAFQTSGFPVLSVMVPRRDERSGSTASRLEPNWFVVDRTPTRDPVSTIGHVCDWVFGNADWMDVFQHDRLTSEWYR